MRLTETSHTMQRTLGVQLFVQLSLIGLFFASINAKAIVQPEQEQLGLYNASDKVCILTGETFAANVLKQNHSIFVEFYNSYCGHCKRFAPLYKQLADNIYAWRDVMPVCAIDCAAEINNDVCREYEVMAYPTLRYIGPGFTPSSNHYGEPIEQLDIDGIRDILAAKLAAENRTTEMTAWPNFKQLTASEATKPFEGLSSQQKFVIVVHEPENSTIGIETILKFERFPAVQIRRVNDVEVANKLQIDGVHKKLATIDRKGNILAYETEAETLAAYAEIITKILNDQHITERPDTLRTTTMKPIESDAIRSEHAAEYKAILDEVKRNKHLVYQSDLEMAIHGALFNEIPKNSHISGESLLALQRFLAVLKRYNPLGPNGRLLINKMQEYVVQFDKELNGKQFEDELKFWEKQLAPTFSSNKFVGCAASQTGLRGFTCSLWQLFHFMTVQAANNDISQDPLEVLQAMHGYIKYYFGCSECSTHFQEMANKRKIWNVPNKDEAVLWLWAAHNEVNQRLSGDETEDPLFPKIQFPSITSCEDCYKIPPKSTGAAASTTANALDDSKWDKLKVLSFLKNIHNPEFVSRFGVENENVLQPSLEKLRSKRMVSSVFTDIDMRMGMLLYGFCIVMMIVAFKLFAYKGYRKKPYYHDVLGKV